VPKRARLALPQLKDGLGRPAGRGHGLPRRRRHRPPQMHLEGGSSTPRRTLVIHAQSQWL
jgi:hypothetical protein